MTQVEQLADFVACMTYNDMSEEARQQLKIRVLDALGCAIGALEGPPISMLRAQVEDFGGRPLVPPGVVPVTEWRPDAMAAGPADWAGAGTAAQAADLYAGIARTPPGACASTTRLGVLIG